MKQSKIKAIQTARSWLAKKPIYLDTETTGLDNNAEVVDIGLVDYNGAELLNTLVRSTTPIPDAAKSVHGIANQDILDAPGYCDILPALIDLTNTRLVIIYNKNYDIRLLEQSAKANKVDWQATFEAVCAMELYARFYGDWNSWYNSYRWQSQEKAAQQLGIKLPNDLHRAFADAELCRLIIEAMAMVPLPDEELILDKEPKLPHFDVTGIVQWDPDEGSDET